MTKTIPLSHRHLRTTSMVGTVLLNGQQYHSCPEGGFAILGQSVAHGEVNVGGAHRTFDFEQHRVAIATVGVLEFS